jgi:hypothetical protein
LAGAGGDLVDGAEEVLQEEEGNGQHNRV